MNGISIIVPAHNNAAVILDALTSVERAEKSAMSPFLNSPLTNNEDGGSDNGDDEQDSTTLSSSETLSNSDSGPDHSSEYMSEALGDSGVVTGGTVDSLETGSDSGSGSTTGNGGETTTDNESGDEEDTGDSAEDSDSTKQSGSYTSSGDVDESSTESESMSEDLGAGGAIADGGSTESSSESSDSTQTLINNGSDSDSFTDEDEDLEGEDTDDGSDSGDDNSTATDTAGTTWIATLSEDIGAEGTIAGGDERDSLEDSSGDTTTETDHPTETVTDSVSDVTMTLDETNTTTETDDEADEDWATETLGTSAVISGGSDCFTVVNLDTSDYDTKGSGPEDGNDTSGSPHGTADTTGSGSSSNYVDQTFGDTLGAGGAIATGSMSFTVETGDSDDLSKTESGTDTVADELSDGTSQTGSYSVDTTTGDHDTDAVTGTETLGSGGTIDGGSDTVSWSDDDSISRGLTIDGIDGATLSITESSTDTDGFGESGTETITTGGGDAPCSLSFDWDQFGTDYYRLNQQNTLSAQSYGLQLTDTVSSSWDDDGVDVLTDSDTVTGQTDNFKWNEFSTLTDLVSETNGGPVSGNGTQSFSEGDTGSETLTDTSGSLTVAEQSDQFDIQDAFAASTNRSGSWNEPVNTIIGFSAEGSATVTTTEGYRFDDDGNDSLSGTSSTESDSYSVTDWVYSSYSATQSGAIDEGSNGTGTYAEQSYDADSYSLTATGTDSLDGDHDESTTAIPGRLTERSRYNGVTTADHFSDCVSLCTNVPVNMIAKYHLCKSL